MANDFSTLLTVFIDTLVEGFQTKLTHNLWKMKFSSRYKLFLLLCADNFCKDPDQTQQNVSDRDAKCLTLVYLKDFFKKIKLFLEKKNANGKKHAKLYSI